MPFRHLVSGTAKWHEWPMISVIIPTLNAERTLAAALTGLVPAAIDGLIREVIVVDGGSSDRTREIADMSGATIFDAPAGRGRQLMRGAADARFPWLLFLHADTVLQDGWEAEAVRLMRLVDQHEAPEAAGVFRFRLNDTGLKPRLLETAVRARCALLALPYGDQGLLISRRLFDDVGGYKDLPIMEDVDLMRRLGRKRIKFFNSMAVTSAERYKRDGYIRRALRNQMCLALYGAGLPAAKIVRIYGRASA